MQRGKAEIFGVLDSCNNISSSARIIEGAARSVSQTTYWAEVDGLRALAVLFVFVFHLDRTILTGGFVGVDIFFVISGFLISGLLLKDIDSQAFSTLNFYQRRIARIAPALFLVLGFTLLASLVFYAAQDIASLGANATFAAMSLLNMKLIFQGNYFDVSSDAQPLLHYWSLSVEEQFYLFFPPLLILVLRVGRALMPVLVVTAIASFVSCVVLTYGAQTFAFYLATSRSWELLLGACIALLRTRNVVFYGRAGLACSLSGLVLMLCAVLFLNETSNFPGLLAIMPALGTALFLATVGNAVGPINRVLSHPALVFLGKRSYSLYLWHWPVFSFIDYRWFQADGVARLAAKVIISSLAALLTYQFVETPARRLLNQPARRGLALTLFLTLSATFIGLGLYLRAYYYLDASPTTIARGGVAVGEGKEGSVVLIGDSQAAMYAFEIADMARDEGFRFHSLAFPAGNQLPGQLGTVWEDVLRFVVIERPDVVVIAQAWESKLGANAAALTEAMSALRPVVGCVVLVTQPPRPPTTATRTALRDGARSPFQEDFAVAVRRKAANARIRSLSKMTGAKLLEVEPVFITSDGGIRVVGSQSQYFFQDAAHLSSFGTHELRGAFEAAILPVLNREGECLTK